jgi:hypothetical protein
VLGSTKFFKQNKQQGDGIMAMPRLRADTPKKIATLIETLFHMRQKPQLGKKEWANLRKQKEAIACSGDRQVADFIGGVIQDKAIPAEDPWFLKEHRKGSTVIVSRANLDPKPGASWNRVTAHC